MEQKGEFTYCGLSSNDMTRDQLIEVIWDLYKSNKNLIEENHRKSMQSIQDMVNFKLNRPIDTPLQKSKGSFWNNIFG